MKSLFFTLILLLALLPTQQTIAGSFSLDHIDGVFNDGGTIKIKANQPVVFYLRLTNDSVSVSGLTNGFRVWTEGGSPFTTIVGDTINSGFVSIWDLVFGISYLSADGSGADTVGFGGSKLTSAGMPVGFDEVVYSITTGNVPGGETLCLDSSFYPPTGSWLWAPGGPPDWDGPHCYLAETVNCLPPDIDNAPTTLTGSHCDVMTFDFNATGSQGGPVFWSANIGTIDANGVWSYAPSLADVGQSLILTVTATDVCDATVDVNLTFTNQAPVLTCPSIQNVSTGFPSTFQVTATDDCDPVSYAIVSDGGLSTATIDANTGELTILGEFAGSFIVTVMATDGNLSSTCDIEFVMIPGQIFQVEIPCVGDQTSNFVFQGQHVFVPVELVTGNVIGGFDFLIAYDNSALSFQNAVIGSDLVINDWEYFTYRFGPDGNCGNACPSGIVRVVGIAETNDGLNHPIWGGVSELSILDFLVTNDRTFECQSIPIRFFWMDCGDNALSNWIGDELMISSHVFDGDETLFPPNGQDIFDPTYGYPTYFGAQEDCDNIIPNKPTPDRIVSFNNGCVNIACADAIDARGDINLNNVANEIADAVLLSNYFIYGLGVFNINTEGQIAASDVNADGLPLSIADLVYLVRIIVGDALPFNKLAAYEEELTVHDNHYSVESEIGAALIVTEGNRPITLLADQMEIKSQYDPETHTTRSLIYAINGNTFSGEFFASDDRLISIELGSAQGAVVHAKIIPDDYTLEQNYPNPFNPTTTISFSIPTADFVTLSIFNINGQKVTSFEGSYQAGVHQIEWDAANNASGIYFYKLESGQFSTTKKMLLLK